MTQFWFILSTIFILLELTNPGLFFFLALSLGALITMLVDFENISPVFEYTFFFASSGIMLVVLNTFVKILQKKKQSKSYASNIDLLIGKTVEITEIISSDTGYGKVESETWMVKAHDKNHILTVGMHAMVTDVKGCHLQVVPITSNI